MDKIKTLFINQWEKILLGVVGFFCLISLSISLSGIITSDNDFEQINEYKKKITNLRTDNETLPLEDYKEKADSFKSKFLDTSFLNVFDNKLTPKIFSEEVKVDVYKDVQDIINGHGDLKQGPGVNCEKFFCKVSGENVCLVCGAKGEREYIFRAPILTDLELLSTSSREKFMTNPFVGRNEIRIIWEDDIHTDRGTYKDRFGRVYRIEVSEELKKAVGPHRNKPTYQQSIISFINENNIKPLNLDGKNSPIKADVIVTKTQATKQNVNTKVDNPNKNVFSETPGEDTSNPGSEEEIAKHALINESAFFIFRDNSFLPLKKYWYVFLEEGVGKSATGRSLNASKFSDYVEVNTKALNNYFLYKVDEKKVDGVPVLENGKPVYEADFQIYQYFSIQDCFYREYFKSLKVNDVLGKIRYNSRGEAETEIMTKIKRDGQYLNGEKLTDEEWFQWRNVYPKAFENKRRSEILSVDQSYDTGMVILEIGRKDVTYQKFLRMRPGPIGPDGRNTEIPETKEVTENKGYVILLNSLTKEKIEVLEVSNTDIRRVLSEEKIYTSDDLAKNKGK